MTVVPCFGLFVVGAYGFRKQNERERFYFVVMHEALMNAIKMFLLTPFIVLSEIRMANLFQASRK